jgi:predicted Zn-dependent protease
MRKTGTGGRLFIALILVTVTLFGYFTKTQTNPVTGKKQLKLTPEEEITLGVQSVPRTAIEFGGLYQDAQTQQLVKRIGYNLVKNSDTAKSPYAFDFHVLGDSGTINAFAVPGGQVFMTLGLLRRFKSEDQLAGVLGHEICHVIGRYSAEYMASQELLQSLDGAASVAISNPHLENSAANVARYITNLIHL